MVSAPTGAERSGHWRPDDQKRPTPSVGRVKLRNSATVVTSLSSRTSPENTRRSGECQNRE